MRKENVFKACRREIRATNNGNNHDMENGDDIDQTLYIKQTNNVKTNNTKSNNISNSSHGLTQMLLDNKKII